MRLLTAIAVSATALLAAGCSAIDRLLVLAHHRWVFDLVLSNPDAVKLYRVSPSQYVKAVGCTH
jgi:hypothetical protein